MNSLKHICSLVFIIPMLTFSHSVLAGKMLYCNNSGETFFTYMPGYSDSRFNIVNSSCKTLVNKHWPSFGMEERYWNGGRGYYNVCDVNTPLNRTLRALELLRISKSPTSYTLNHAYDQAKKSIHHLRMECAESRYDRASAVNVMGSGTVYLFQNIFSGSIVSLASTLVHEAGHKGKPHNGGIGCLRRASCDTSIKYFGANARQLYYSWFYGLKASNSNLFTRQMALDKARTIQDSAFNIRPKYHIRKTAR